MKVAFLLQTGNFTAGYPTEGAGAYALAERMIAEVSQLWDRRESWVDVLVYDAKLQYTVAGIHNFNPDVIVHWGHSHGCGFGLVHFAAELESVGRKIDLAICCDPVPYFGGSHFIPTEKPFVLPNNVMHGIGFRTTNQPNLLTPWGRRIASNVGAPTMQHVYGKESPTVIHGTIDNHMPVHDESVAAVKRLLA